jgi:two-component system chemotaxis response regulator CheY
MLGLSVARRNGRTGEVGELLARNRRELQKQDPYKGNSKPDSVLSLWRTKCGWDDVSLRRGIRNLRRIDTGMEVICIMQDDLIMLRHAYRPDFSASPSSILLVDDDPDIRSLTRTFLEHEGYRVFSSGDAERASQIFSSVPRIDLLITDLYMPHRSGMELACELKALRKDLPVLMISGGAVDGNQQKQLQSEGWRFMAKPFIFTELLEMVHRILAPWDMVASPAF